MERLNSAVRRGNAEAPRLLRRFPGIGPPSADKIMLLCGGALSLAPDSKSLRVLARLGYATEQKSYAKTYQMAIAATRREIHDADQAVGAHLLLRKHGQELAERRFAATVR